MVCDAVIIGSKPRSQSGKRWDVPKPFGRVARWQTAAGKILPHQIRRRAILNGSSASDGSGSEPARTLSGSFLIQMTDKSVGSVKPRFVASRSIAVRSMGPVWLMSAAHYTALAARVIKNADGAICGIISARGLRSQVFRIETPADNRIGPSKWFVKCVSRVACLIAERTGS